MGVSVRRGGRLIDEHLDAWRAEMEAVAVPADDEWADLDAAEPEPRAVMAVGLGLEEEGTCRNKAPPVGFEPTTGGLEGVRHGVW
jgi:hypothetical protein